MAKVPLTIATSAYDHTRDFLQGTIEADGIEINYLPLSIEETFYRFTKYREWDVSEMSCAKYVSLRSQGDDSISAIPVFPSRVFRQSSFYVLKNSPIKKAEDLRGKRIGIPEWAQTAAVYSRGWLVHQVGIPLQEIDWIQAGVNQPGRVEKVEIKLPEGVRYSNRHETSLTEMLLKGEIDAAMTAHPPMPFEEGGSEIVLLYPNYREVEEAYYRDTGIFPIMHTVAIKREVLDRNPWIAMNLYKAFIEAKENSVHRALEFTASRFPFAWSFDAAAKIKDLFGEDFFPYGVEANRVTLEAFLQYALEQGVIHRKLSVEELFCKEVQSEFRV